jgi:hypothetical protein
MQTKWIMTEMLYQIVLVLVRLKFLFWCMTHGRHAAADIDHGPYRGSEGCIGLRLQGGGACDDALDPIVVAPGLNVSDALVAFDQRIHSDGICDVPFVFLIGHF